MPTTTLDKNCKIEIPKALRDKRGLKPGNKVWIEESPDGNYIVKIGRDAASLIGMLDGNGIHLTIEQINDIISRQDHRH